MKKLRKGRITGLVDDNKWHDREIYLGIRCWKREWLWRYRAAERGWGPLHTTFVLCQGVQGTICICVCARDIDCVFYCFANWRRSIPKSRGITLSIGWNFIPRYFKWRAAAGRTCVIISQGAAPFRIQLWMSANQPTEMADSNGRPASSHFSSPLLISVSVYVSCRYTYLPFVLPSQ